MQNLDTNDWVFFNSIIYNIHTMKYLDDMRTQLLHQLKNLVDYDSADFYLAAPDGSDTLTDPIFYNIEKDPCVEYDSIDYSRGILYSGKSIIYRETDIMPDEKRVETDYYKKVYVPNQWHYSLQIILAKKKEFVGVITLYRKKGKVDFQYDDIFLLDLLKDHLSYRLYQHRKQEKQQDEKMTVSEATTTYDLTKQESTILKLLLDGKTNGMICETLKITENTLKKHILNLYRKLEVKNRVGLFKKIKEKE